MAEELDAGTPAFARRTFDLAREGRTAELVDAGRPVDLTNGKGDTLLILAAYHARPETVRARLERGADHTRVDDRGQTALAAAVFRSCGPAVSALLAAGADPAHGEPSALATARFFDLPDMAALLRGEAAPDA